jgi:hypothetical protein
MAVEILLAVAVAVEVIQWVLLALALIALVCVAANPVLEPVYAPVVPVQL